MRPRARAELHGLEAEPWFVDELRGAGADLGGPPPFDLVFARVDAPHELAVLSRLRERIRPDGAIWVVRVKGNARRVSDVDIIDAARAHGLVDNKIAAFSDTLAAMRLVIPVALRSPTGRRKR